MRPTVIHIHQAPVGWIHNPRYQYIGRGGHGHSGTLGNPIKLSMVGGRSLPSTQNVCMMCGEHHTDRGSTLVCYEQWLRQKISMDPDYRQMVKELWGKILVCFCKPAPCHGDILAQVCEELNLTA